MTVTASHRIVDGEGFRPASPNRGLGLLTNSEEPTPRSSKWGTGMNVMAEAFEKAPSAPPQLPPTPAR